MTVLNFYKGVPRQAVRLVGERTSSEASELSCLHGNECYVACEDEVAEVAVRVAVKSTAATRKKPCAARVSGLWVAEVAVLQTSQPKLTLLGSKLEIWV